MQPLTLSLMAFVLGSAPRPAELWSSKFVADCFIPLYRLAQAQELLWFLSEQLDSNGTEQLQDLMLSVNRALATTQMVLTNRTDIRIMRTENKRNAFGVVLTTDPDDFILTVLDKVLLGRHFQFNIIIVAHPLDDFRVVERFMLGMKQCNFQTSILYYQASNGSNELFGYTIFPEYEVQNRSDFFGYIRRNYAKFMSGGLDLELYQFKTPLRLDLPGVFRYADRSGRVHQQGIAYKLLNLFVDYINGTIGDYAMPQDRLGGDVIDMRAALELVRARKVDLLAHAYALFKIDEDIDKSYPIMVVRWCLMVPVWNSVSTFYYPVQPFHALVWYAWASAFVALMAMDGLQLLWQHTQDGCCSRRQLLTQLREHLLNNFCFVLNIATARNLRTPTKVRFLLYAAIFFHGFFLSANYTSLLGSILTVTLFRAQINTMDDLIWANISVMIIDYELDFLLSEGNELPANFLQLLRVVDAAIFSQHQTTLNTSFAYFVTEDKWHFLELQQKHRKQGIFKLSDICFGSYHLAYPMPPESPIWRSLEYFLFRVHSSGMLQYHESTAFDFAVHAGLVQRYAESSEYTSAGMQHLLMVFMLLLLMYCIGLCALISECLLHRLKQRRAQTTAAAVKIQWK